MSRTCPNCGGKGRVVENPCTGCRGEGRERKQRNLTVRIPPGVDNGNRLRIRGEGDGGLSGGGSGDLFVQVEVKEHQFFMRENDDIICEVPIRMEVAAVGGTVEVPTGRGDQYLRINVEVPSKVTKKQKQLLEEFTAESKPSAYKTVSKFSKEFSKYREK